MKQGYSTILQVSAIFVIFALFSGVAINSQHATAYKVNISKVASIIHDKVNQVRAEHGLPSLSYSEDMQKVAQYRSDDMASKGYFSHTAPNGDKPSDVAKKMGINCRNELGGGRYSVGIGENIYKKTGQLGSEESIAQAAFKGWMNSSGHRANILNGNYHSEGIAFSISGNSVWVTQNFC